MPGWNAAGVPVTRCSMQDWRSRVLRRASRYLALGYEKCPSYATGSTAIAGDVGQGRNEDFKDGSYLG
jgi:hypothetical protein